ncbi:MAG: hypothetical protein QOG83_1568 [Alphaproteobacteria bacterium]|jgi:hypothetical protein|nr:hypothetical protein [Alphaproteobacteria bacterium]MEA2937144.1 hypothetical protein [Alphaproteobacteria bacterium]MEA2988857.1 hypothetical protein [Alphaproteobacteria bacterium]
MISHLVRASVLAFACAVAVTTTASARTPYDGAWSVTIVTQRGTCDRAYRYGVQIIDGQVSYQGVVTFSGRVSSNGNVRVRVSSSSAYANGSGRLSRTAGRGSWSGQSGNSACSGYWTAERGG